MSTYVDARLEEVKKEKKLYKSAVLYLLTGKVLALCD